MQKLQEKLTTYTSLGRSLDPACPGNLAIMILLPVVGLTGFAQSVFVGHDFMSSIGSGLMMAVIVFTTWALSREIDPDHPSSAFVAAGAAVITLMFSPATDPLLIAQLGTVLMLMRIVNRTVGPPARLGDSLIIFGAAAFLALSGAWLIALIAANAFLLDASLQKGQRHQFYFAALSFGLISAAWAANRISGPATVNWPYMIPTLVITALTLLFISRLSRMRSQSDVGGQQLDPQRVQAGAALLLAFGLFNGFWYGDQGVVSMLPVWATLAGVSGFVLLTKANNVQASERESSLN